MAGDTASTETYPVNLPSSVASYTDEMFADIAEHLEERGVTDSDRVTRLDLRVEAGEAVEVVRVESDD